jgi:hypothetical protein
MDGSEMRTERMSMVRALRPVLAALLAAALVVALASLQTQPVG